jgi:hypothetical protein
MKELISISGFEANHKLNYLLRLRQFKKGVDNLFKHFI